MAKKRIYELLNKAVLTVTDLFMIDKSGDANATNVTGQQIVDLVQDNTDFTDLQDVPTDYTGDGGKYVMVALTEDGLEFTTISFDNVANGTLTGNRTVSGGGFSLTLNALTRIVSTNASSSVDAFLIRSFGDGSNLVQVKGNGEAVFNPSVETTYLRTNFWNSKNNALNFMTYDLEGLGEMNHNRRSIFQRETEVRLQTATTANFRIKNFNNTLVCFNVTENGKVSMPLIPTSAEGLSAGDVWNQNGHLRIV